MWPFGLTQFRWIVASQNAVLRQHSELLREDYTLSSSQALVPLVFRVWVLTLFIVVSCFRSLCAESDCMSVDAYNDVVQRVLCDLNGTEVWKDSTKPGRLEGVLEAAKALKAPALIDALLPRVTFAFGEGDGQKLRNAYGVRDVLATIGVRAVGPILKRLTEIDPIGESGEVCLESRLLVEILLNVYRPGGEEESIVLMVLSKARNSADLVGERRLQALIERLPDIVVVPTEKLLRGTSNTPSEGTDGQGDE